MTEKGNQALAEAVAAAVIGPLSRAETGLPRSGQPTQQAGSGKDNQEKS